MSSSNGASVGFRSAPVCKFLLGSAIGSSFLLKFPLKQHHHTSFTRTTKCFYKYRELQILCLNGIVQTIWRVLTSKLAFLDLKDLFVCSILIYYFKIFEKRLGSRKFFSHLLGSGILSVLLELACVYLCRVFEVPLQPLPTGPLCIIYPMFVPFYCDIPRVALSHIWGVPMTGKSISYILGLQAASSSPESLLVALCGLVNSNFYIHYTFEQGLPWASESCSHFLRETAKLKLTWKWGPSGFNQTAQITTELGPIVQLPGKGKSAVPIRRISLYVCASFW
ncbi:ubiquitin-associated domain-containing protein 2-like [Mercenaria mercenaria]|uniref:ubiquitin-associated domain-containing protein 2-like n=1 Tax=Mercenaria mercenaria TaxID=6596 RepID=UPI00234F16D1|nr:ubiquitin-associated domain-containing protein 2-like [Mercenaria mercenaria]